MSIITVTEITHLFNSLHEILKSSKAICDTDSQRCEACKSQSSFAHFMDSIFPGCSLNTLKAAADRHLSTDSEHGWARLDDLRKQLYERYKEELKSNAKTEVRISNEVKLLEADRGRIRCTAAYFDCLRILRGAAIDNPKLKRELLQHLQKFGKDWGVRLVE